MPSERSQEISSTFKDIQEKQKKLKELQIAEHLDRIKKDEVLNREIYALVDNYEENKIDKAKDLAHSIYNKFRHKPIQFESDPEQEFNDFIASGAPKKLAGWFKLNVSILGGSMVMLGAKTKVGKSSASLNVAAWNNENNIKTLILTNEMTPMECRVRLFTNHVYRKSNKSTSLDFHYTYEALRSPKTDTEKIFREDYLEFEKNLRENVLIYDASSYKDDDYAMAMDHSYNYFGTYPEWTIIDYVQFMDVSGNSLREGMIKACNMIVRQAKEMNTVVLAVSQMNDDGKYAESSIWERTAKVNIVLEQDPEAIGMIKFTIKNGRFVGNGYSDLDFEKVSGAIG